MIHSNPPNLRMLSTLPRLPLFLALAAALPLHAHAQQAAHDDHRHDPVDLDAVQVRATPIRATADQLSRPVEVLAGERLDAVKSATLGETVARLPGVQSSWFGPGVGRPVIRGFDAARVQVLSDGLGTGDVSTVSVDHAVSLEPFLADQIEVLKGPSTLLYGSGAIGGAVNVIDGRVPERTTHEPLEGRAELRAGTVNDERTGMLRLDGTTAGGNVVFHLDALHRETGDHDIPGHAESAALQAAEGHDHGGDARGVLPNSALRTDSAALGLSWVGERGFLGGAVSLYNSRYGVPGHVHAPGDDHAHDHGHDHDHDHGDGDGHGDAGDHAVTILMDQRRTEVRGGLDDLGWFESLRASAAHTRYTHTEFEGRAVGTVFDNDSLDARVELVHRPVAGWAGAVGAQWSEREFHAAGHEAFVPDSEGSDLGVFWLGQRSFGPVQLEAGVRHDHVDIDVDPAQASGPSRGFDNTSASLSARWDVTDGIHLMLGLDRAQRAPTAEELYSAGYHVATASMEIGDPGLDSETANRLELGLHWHHGPLALQLAAFHVRYDDFIHLSATGIDDGGPVHAWNQADARFNGGEASLDWEIADNHTGAWNLRLFGDVVRAKLAGGPDRTIEVPVPHGDHAHLHQATLPGHGNLPRIAPRRLGTELGWMHGPWRASVGAIRYDAQDDVARHETPSDAYTLVDASLAWHMDTRGGSALELFVEGRNLLDEEARVHTSPLKDLAPMPGRGVSFGVRAFF